MIHLRLLRSVAAPVVLAAALGGCMSGGEGGSTLGNLLAYGGPTVPPAAPTPVAAFADCPPVTVDDGRAAIRSPGDSARSQISISNVARECTERPDGTVVVKVGVEGRVLLGPGGAPGRFEAPVTVVVKRGDQVFASRSRRVAVTVAPGEIGAAFSVVEGDIVIPAGAGEFEIEAGLGANRIPAAARRRAKT